MALADIPVIGGLFGDSSETKAGKQRLALMQAASQDYAAQRAINAQQRMNALRNIAGMFGPANHALGQMYGPGSQFDLGAFSYSPMITQNLSHPGAGLPGSQAWKNEEQKAADAQAAAKKAVSQGMFSGLF